MDGSTDYALGSGARALEKTAAGALTTKLIYPAALESVTVIG